MERTTILMTAAEDIIVRNVFLTEFWPTFSRTALERGWNIVVAVPPDHVERVRKLLGSARIVPYERAPAGRLERAIMSLARSSINSHTNLWSKMRSYERGDSGLLATYAKRTLTSLVGNSSLWKRFVRQGIERLPSDRAARSLFDEVRPSVFLPLSLTNFEFDVPLAREARLRTIPIIGMVRSWDNLSSHGLLRVVPDVFVLQNPFLHEMANQYQALTARMRVRIAGVPHYDRYLTRTAIPKEELFRILGLDATKKLFVYGAMGEFLFPTERGIPTLLEKAVHASGRHDAQVVFRAHPRFIPKGGFGTFENVHIHIPESYTASGTYSSEDILFSTIAHADLVITGASTFALDALVIGRPVVCIAFDGAEVSYWESAGRFFDTFTHFEEFIRTSGIPVAWDVAELSRHLRDLPRIESDRRHATLERFVGFADGSSGKRLAAITIEEVITCLR